MKIALTICEAAACSNIGMNKTESVLKEPHCAFVLYAETKRLVKRKEFEAYLSQKLSI